MSATAKALLAIASSQRESGDMVGAVSTLYKAKDEMLASDVAYTADTWCRLPLYLQKAGRYAECIREFDFLLTDLERRLRRDTRLDNSSFGPDAQKRRAYERLLTDHRAVIEAKQRLAVQREVKRAGTASQSRRAMPFTMRPPVTP